MDGSPFASRFGREQSYASGLPHLDRDLRVACDVDSGPMVSTIAMVDAIEVGWMVSPICAAHFFGDLQTGQVFNE